MRGWLSAIAAECAAAAALFIVALALAFGVSLLGPHGGGG